MKKLTHHELSHVSGGFTVFAALAGGMYAGYNNDDEAYEAVARTTGWVGVVNAGYAAYKYLYSPMMAAVNAGAGINPVAATLVGAGAILGIASSFPVNRFATFLGYKAGEIAAS